MPYIRLEHALTRYCSLTGLRAILADQGQNDLPENLPSRGTYVCDVSAALFPTLKVVNGHSFTTCGRA